MTKKTGWLVYQCWVAPGVKSLSEAINNPRLLRTTHFDDKIAAETYLQQCEDRHEERFVYWLEP